MHGDDQEHVDIPYAEKVILIERFDRVIAYHLFWNQEYMSNICSPRLLCATAPRI